MPLTQEQIDQEAYEAAPRPFSRRSEVTHE